MPKLREDNAAVEQLLKHERRRLDEIKEQIAALQLERRKMMWRAHARLNYPARKAQRQAKPPGRIGRPPKNERVQT